MRSMQKDLEDLREARQREARQAQDDREELAIFRDRCNKLEEENESRQGAVIIILPQKKCNCSRESRRMTLIMSSS